MSFEGSILFLIYAIVSNTLLNISNYKRDYTIIDMTVLTITERSFIAVVDLD